jgi:hypothetical protein
MPPRHHLAAASFALIVKTSVCTREEPATVEQPVYAVFDWKQRQNVKSHQEHNCEFNVGAKRIGQRFLIGPYCPQKESAENPESENGAPAERFSYSLHGFNLAEGD